MEEGQSSLLAKCLRQREVVIATTEEVEMNMYQLLAVIYSLNFPKLVQLLVVIQLLAVIYSLNCPKTKL